MKKKIIIGLLSVVALLLVNQILYVIKVQYICDEKINSGKDLNFYETVSALQAHCALWMFGWIIEPNTARACFDKQFFIYDPVIVPSLPEDDEVIKAAKQKLLKGKANYLNGSTISIMENEGTKMFLYEIPLDYKPGIVNIGGIDLSETVFDYLENKGLLAVYTSHRTQKIHP
jgi:hypothetical protein